MFGNISCIFDSKIVNFLCIFNFHRQNWFDRYLASTEISWRCQLQNEYSADPERWIVKNESVFKKCKLFSGTHCSFGHHSGNLFATGRAPSLIFSQIGQCLYLLSPLLIMQPLSTKGSRWGNRIRWCNVDFDFPSVWIWV